MPKMYQMLFIVLDTFAKKVLGAYNDYDKAEEVALLSAPRNYNGREIVIVPVTVDMENPVAEARSYCYNKQQVFDAMQDELDLAYEDYLDEGKEEAEEEAEYEEDEYEDEDEKDEDEYDLEDDLEDDEDEDEDDDEDDDQDEDEDDDEDGIVAKAGEALANAIISVIKALVE